MNVKRGTAYAEAGKVLRNKKTGSISYQAQGLAADFDELDAPCEDMRLSGGILRWGGGLCATAADCDSYAAYKAKLVKLRYSNDDQIAVLANGDAQESRQMQQWREWAARVASLICRRCGILR